jgi:3-oxoacyl-[acyl-carrier-protein] synthase-3
MTEQRIGILGLGAYLPERVMSNAEWAQYVDTSDEWITTRTGIKNRRIAADNETTVDLAAAAARAAIEDAGLAVDAIDEIILATDTPEVKLPDTASYLQTVLGAREIPSFDLAGSGCAGFVLGLDIARSRAMTGDKKVLLVGVEMLTRLVSWNDRTTAVLFGDAAGAAIVGAAEGSSELLTFTAGTDGSRAEILCLETGGTRAPFTIEAAQRGDHKKLVMNGREVFKEAVSRMGAASRKVLADAGVEVSDLTLVVPHQANLRIINALQKSLGIADDQLFINVQEYGNTGSASIPLALWEARQQGRVKPGDLVLLTAFGAGFHWAAMLLRF